MRAMMAARRMDASDDVMWADLPSPASQPWHNSAFAPDGSLKPAYMKQAARIAEMVAQTRALPSYTPKPILFTEDDHFAFDEPDNNFLSALSAYASWGYFDPGGAAGG